MLRKKVGKGGKGKHKGKGRNIPQQPGLRLYWASFGPRFSSFEVATTIRDPFRGKQTGRKTLMQAVFSPSGLSLYWVLSQAHRGHPDLTSTPRHAPLPEKIEKESLNSQSPLKNHSSVRMCLRSPHWIPQLSENPHRGKGHGGVDNALVHEL